MTSNKLARLFRPSDFPSEFDEIEKRRQGRAVEKHLATIARALHAQDVPASTVERDPLVRDGRTTSWSAAAHTLRYPAPGAADGDALRSAARRAAEGRGSTPELARLWRDAVTVGKRGRSPRVVDVDAVNALWARGASVKPTSLVAARR